MKLFFFTICILILVIQLPAQEWEQISSVPDGFTSDHSIGFSLNGKGYIVAGSDSNGDLSSAVYEYDPVFDLWTKRDDHPAGVRGYGIGDVYNGKLYMGFGVNDGTILNDLWEFDGETWKELSPCTCPGRLHPAFTISKGKIHVGLGNNSSGNLDDWWEYDIETDKWKELPNLPSAKRHHPYQFSLGDYVYTGLGHGDGIFNNWFQYDPELATWTEVTSLPAEGRVAGAQFEHGEYGFVLSGEGEDHRAMISGEFWRYDPELDFWDELAPHPGSSRWAPATFIIDGYVYLINGMTFINDYDYRADNYRYFLDDNVSTTSETLDFLDVALYPNPVKDFLFLDIELREDVDILSIKLVDISGKVIRTLEKGTKKIDVSFLARGHYNIVYFIGSQSYTKSFFKY